MILDTMSIFSTVSGNDFEAEKLFTKTLIVAVKEGSSLLSRKSKLQVSVEWTTAITPVHRKELVIRMTDENDPFFIYVLNLPEEDFQSLKSQQGLLVDFVAFPRKFIDLLELCLQEEHKDVPKFLLTLTTPGQMGMSGGACQLDVIETNPFKHLTHLSLKVQPASDIFVKKYLASSLKNLKEENARLESSLRSTQSDLQERLKQTQDALSTRTLELDRVRNQLHMEIGSLGKKHTDELKIEQERLMRIHKDEEQRWDREKCDMEIKHGKETQQLESRVTHLESQNKDLQERLYKSESTVRELRGRLIASEEELQQLRQKAQSMTKETQSLDSQYHEQLRMIGQLRSRSSMLEQELRDKEQIHAKAQELFQTTQEQKQRLEELCEQKHTTLNKRENSIKILSEELNKGNEIIKKLQTEIRSYHSKLKLRSQISTKQEEVLGEKDEQLVIAHREIANLQQQSKARETEVEKMSSELESAKQRLEENEKHIKTNENVISWLNKQLNEVQLNHRKVTDQGSTLVKQPQVFTSTPAFRPSIPVTLNRGVTYPTYQPWYPLPNPMAPSGSLPSATPSTVQTLAHPTHNGIPVLQEPQPVQNPSNVVQAKGIPTQPGQTKPNGAIIRSKSMENAGQKTNTSKQRTSRLSSANK